MSTARIESKVEDYKPSDDMNFIAFKEIWARPLNEEFIAEYCKSITPESHSMLSLRFRYLTQEEDNFLNSLVKNILDKLAKSKEKSLDSGEWMILGKAYELGIGVEKNYKLALNAYQKANNPLGNYESGCMCLRLGEESIQDELHYKYYLTRAIKYFEDAKALHIPEAYYMLGDMQRYGRLLPFDRDKALENFRISAGLGCRDAAYAIAIEHANLNGTVTIDMALDNLQKAIRKGSPIALFNFAEGIIKWRQYNLKYELHRKLIDQGPVRLRTYCEELVKRKNTMQLNETEKVISTLADVYADGTGGSVNLLKAVILHRTLIEMGNAQHIAENLIESRMCSLIYVLTKSNTINIDPEIIYHTCIALDEKIFAKSGKTKFDDDLLQELYKKFNEIALNQTALFIQLMNKANDSMWRIGSVLSPEATTHLKLAMATQIDEHFFRNKMEKSLSKIAADYLFFNPIKPTGKEEKSEPRLSESVAKVSPSS